jgi:hypothetical protein
MYWDRYARGVRMLTGAVHPERQLRTTVTH